MYEVYHSLLNKFEEIRTIIRGADDSEKELLYEMLGEYGDFIQTKDGADYFDIKEESKDDEGAFDRADEYGVLLFDESELIFIDEAPNEEEQNEKRDYIKTLLKEANIYIPNRIRRVG